MPMSVCISIYLSISISCLPSTPFYPSFAFMSSVCPSCCLFVFPFVCLYSLSLCKYPALCLSIQSVYLFVCLSVRLPNPLSICVSVPLFVCLSVSPFTCLSIHPLNFASLLYSGRLLPHLKTRGRSHKTFLE
jgi:hypothetical protein